MKLEEYKKDSYEFSKITSELIRKFAFAGIGLIWIFKYDTPNTTFLPDELLMPLVFLVITLTFDLFQYLLPSIIWTRFYKYYEKKGLDEEEDIKANNLLSLPGWICYYGKILSLGISFSLILRFLIGKI